MVSHTSAWESRAWVCKAWWGSGWWGEGNGSILPLRKAGKCGGGSGGSRSWQAACSRGEVLCGRVACCTAGLPLRQHNANVSYLTSFATASIYTHRNIMLFTCRRRLCARVGSVVVLLVLEEFSRRNERKKHGESSEEQCRSPRLHFAEMRQRRGRRESRSWRRR